ncbi:SDR family NAD(P)-dependent oxidoreductase [Streptomyces calidiresistens]|uniref:SDR family oxidoreductase n=1 Tax=Streptomyces calidiresistens TaxID=1485586 RepID=A0A7W3T4J7_9ACTN|nr:SDR family oxidoreductase [Streptomyces calidiresistens]MBB0230807.1 SDR family oxidoreductase [Streptomyces calidiresistens]
MITGGGTGIGLATARAFAASGDRTLLVGRRSEVIERAAAGIDGAGAFAADLTEPAGAAALADAVRERWGGVDVVIHSAGGNGLLEPAPGPGTDRLTGIARDWELNFRLNTLTAVLTTEALLEADLLRRDGGRVLFLGSIAAYRGSGSGSYGAAKAALHPYAHDLARRLGPSGTTVNVVAPGLITDTEFFGDTMTEERLRARVAETLNGRAGTPEDVAATLHWLASPGAGHVTSQIIQVNGGAERGH